MDILRFITAGNVDDGKSTLIGRLLYDTNNIKSDVLDSVSSGDDAGGNPNLAHITDGLRTERAQGITIDVAYKYFTTPRRKYIITDAPGHFQYTKNLVTGASGVDVVIILIDACNGITEQTRRHSLVVSFLKIQHVVVAINKMDMLGYDEQVFNNIKNEFLAIAGQLQIHNATFIPISALLGDNVSAPSGNMDWYKGDTLMQYLETCETVIEHGNAARYAIQCEIDAVKPGFEKGYAGKILSGTLRVGERIGVYPAGTASVIAKIANGYNEVTEANAGENIILYLDPATFAKRGDVIAHTTTPPFCTHHFEVVLCWLNNPTPLQMQTDYFLRINGAETICKITEVIYKTDIRSFEKYNDTQTLEVNQFARVKVQTKEAIAYDHSTATSLSQTARGIIIDVNSNYTSAAFVIIP
jgi:sulfate adenylyltransferase subunit 1